MSTAPCDRDDLDMFDTLCRAVGSTKLMVWLRLLEGDFDSARIAHEGYSRADEQMPSPFVAAQQPQRRHLFHHARAFVCAVRRIGRLLEAFAGLSTGPGDLPASAVELVKSVWKKKKAFLDTYVEPRNVIEHVDGEMRGKPSATTLFVANNIAYDTYEAAPGKEADISGVALERVLTIRDEILNGLWAIAEEEGGRSK